MSKCPLLRIGILANNKTDEWNRGMDNCLGEDCAWYRNIEGHGICAMVAISVEICKSNYLKEMIGEVSEK